MPAIANLYRDDFCAWIEAQAALLRQGRLQDIDADLLAEATGFDKTNRRTAHVGKKIEWDVPNIAISAIT